MKLRNIEIFKRDGYDGYQSSPKICQIIDALYPNNFDRVWEAPMDGQRAAIKAVLDKLYGPGVYFWGIEKIEVFE